MIKLTIRFFATLKDHAGTDRTTVEIDSPATVEDLIANLAAQFPLLEAALPSSLVAINHEYAFPNNTLGDGDEVAFFPPVSGGSQRIPTDSLDYFAITNDTLDINAIVDAITGPETGGVCIFTGAVRGVTHQANHLPETDYLEYEAYQPMAEATLRQIADEIRERYPEVQGIALVQRIGRLAVGDTTVLTACSAGHRNQGIFEAARYGIDRLKEIVPVWKKEVGPTGQVWIEGEYRPTPDDVATKSSRAIDIPDLFELVCPECHERYSSDTEKYRCDCGEPLNFARVPEFDASLIDNSEQSMWRYRAFIAPADTEPASLGEGWTPLMSTVDETDRRLWLKLDGLNPTGSFKDRGASLLVTMLRTWNRQTIHDDSSGNAGAALAAYAARAGLDATLYVPAYASPAKLRQISQYGATLNKIEGPRSQASERSELAAEAGDSFYASHVYHPFALAGYKTLAYELWEQLGRNIPHVVVAPLGQGTQIIGLADGFADLRRAGVIDTVPRLIGVQSVNCAPLWSRLHDPDAGTGKEGETLAEGIRIIHPIRGQQVLDGITGSGGDIIVVSDDSIVRGMQALARRGVSVEPTSAVVWTGYEHIRDSLEPNSTVVLSITGSGLKTPASLD